MSRWIATAKRTFAMAAQLCLQALLLSQLSGRTGVGVCPSGPEAEESGAPWNAAVGGSSRARGLGGGMYLALLVFASTVVLALLLLLD